MCVFQYYSQSVQLSMLRTVLTHLKGLFLSRRLRFSPLFTLFEDWAVNYLYFDDFVENESIYLECIVFDYNDILISS